MADKKEEPPYEPPDLREFVARAPLYIQLRLRHVARNRGVTGGDRLPEKMPEFTALLLPEFKVDAYCPTCKQDTIYVGRTIGKDERDNLVKQMVVGGTRYFEIIMNCSRVAQHELVVPVRVYSWTYPQGVQLHDRDVYVTKIGMFPPLADLQQPLSPRLAKVIGEKAVREFKRGVGLASHGIGIGAFVYLRRIFEDLIDEVATAAMQAGEVATDEYERSRVDEKIGLLKSHLPRFLLDNRQWYGIVSKGIHELDENECLEYFPVIRQGIEIILDQKAEAFERAEREKEAASAIQKIASKIVGSQTP